MKTTAALTFEQSAIFLAWAAIILLAFAMAGLLRLVYSLGHLIDRGNPRESGPAHGDTAPVIPELNGAARSILLFVDPGCGSCDQALRRLTERASQTPSADTAFAVLYRDAAPDGLDPDLILISHADDIFIKLDVTMTPLAVVLNERRNVLAGAPVGSPELVDQLVDYAIREAGTSR